MSQVNQAIAELPRRDVRRVLTAAALVAAMCGIAAVQLRAEAARERGGRTAAQSVPPAPFAGVAPGR